MREFEAVILSILSTCVIVIIIGCCGIFLYLFGNESWRWVDIATDDTQPCVDLSDSITPPIVANTMVGKNPRERMSPLPLINRSFTIKEVIDGLELN